MSIQGERWTVGVNGGVWVCGHGVWTRRQRREGSQGGVWVREGCEGGHTRGCQRGEEGGGEGAHVNMRLIVTQEGDPSQSPPARRASLPDARSTNLSRKRAP